MKIIREDDFSVIDTGGYGEKLRVPRTYGLLITQSPDALPQSYKKLFGAKDTKLGLCDKHPAILLQGSQSEIGKGLSGFVIQQLFI